jgi:hypothetical protein
MLFANAGWHDAIRQYKAKLYSLRVDLGVPEVTKVSSRQQQVYGFGFETARMFLRASPVNDSQGFIAANKNPVFGLECLQVPSPESLPISDCLVRRHGVDIVSLANE